MELTKKILNIALAFGIVILSLSVFIYAIRDSKAKAAPQANSNGYMVVGVAHGENYTYIVGYNPNANKGVYLDKIFD